MALAHQIEDMRDALQELRDHLEMALSLGDTETATHLLVIKRECEERLVNLLNILGDY